MFTDHNNNHFNYSIWNKLSFNYWDRYVYIYKKKSGDQTYNMWSIIDLKKELS